MTSPVPFIRGATASDPRTRVAEISIATALLFSTIASDQRTEDWPAGWPSFLDVRGTNGTNLHTPNGLVYVWGDVLKGIEEMSHNVTATLLTLPLGTMDAQCFSDYQAEVYRYRSSVLWVPYGVGRFTFLSCYDLTFFPLCFIDSLGHCSTFTGCCRQDHGKK